MTDRMTAVIMAGGEGLRCRPLTETTPKPMLPVGGRPLLEILVRRLGNAGVERIFLVVRYLREQIEAHFGAGGYGVEIHYLREPRPYGTAGGLTLIPAALRPREPFLVVNGDVLTPLNFLEIYDFHVVGGYALTLVVRDHEIPSVPYGVPIIRGDTVIDFYEKPRTTPVRVNSGIYCLDPGLLDYLPNGPSDMPDLIKRVCGRARVGAFDLRVPFHEIGSAASYQTAEAFFAAHMQSPPASSPSPAPTPPQRNANVL